MDWIIEDEEIERRARELAALTGETVEEAIHNAVREQLEIVRAKQAAEKKKKKREKITPP